MNKPEDTAMQTDDKRLWGVIARNQAEAGLAAIMLEDSVLGSVPHDMRSFTVVRGGYGTGAGWAENTNLFNWDPAKIYDLLWLDKAVPLTEGPWSSGLIKSLIKRLRYGGRLVLPVPLKRRNNCQVGAAEVDGILGEPEQVIEDLYRVYKITDQSIDGTSIVEWYMDNFGKILLDLVRPNNVQNYLALSEDSLTREFLRPPLNALEIDPVQMATGLTADSLDLEKNIDAYVASMAYLVHGISYKAAVMAEIIANKMGSEVAVKCLDIGGANGVLAGELLLQDKINVVEAHTHELLLRYLNGVRDIYLNFRQSFKNRFSFSLGSMVDYDFSVDYNVVSFIGCLYLSGPEHWGDVVGRAVARLPDGGLIIIHENLRDNRTNPSHQNMFRGDELMTLLEKHGIVECYHTLTGRKIDYETNRGRTMFWVVQKGT